LLYAIVEDVEILATKPRDEMAGGIRYCDTDAYAIDGDADGWAGFLRLADGK
jgi:hypothetical protein